MRSEVAAPERFVASSALLALACALTAALVAGPAGAPAAAPNIVVIQTDDMTRADLYATYTDPLTGVPTR